MRDHKGLAATEGGGRRVWVSKTASKVLSWDGQYRASVVLVARGGSTLDMDMQQVQLSRTPEIICRWWEGGYSIRALIGLSHGDGVDSFQDEGQ